MLPLRLAEASRPLEVLCIGAHSDDIEIGCGATLRGLAQRGHRLRVTWAVLSAPAGERECEARASAGAWLRGIGELDLQLSTFPDARFPALFNELKDHFAHLRSRIDPDIVFTHALEDRHQDHRLVAELSWQVWRDHLVLEYEVPKYEGDLGRPNCYIPATREVAEAKFAHLMQHFGSQRSKAWFDAETFRGLMRLRGIECRAPEGFAEAFLARKFML
jgi:LmbE family N-acetylglucosaminyl deacetylase